MADPQHRSIRRRIREFMFPMWVSVPISFLGFLFLGLPLGVLNSWNDYYVAIALATLLGVWTYRRYRVDVERPVEGLVLWRVEDRKHYKGDDES